MNLRTLTGFLGIALLCAAPAAHAQAGQPASSPAQAAPAAAPIDPEKAKLIHRLLELTGTPNLIRQSIGQMIASFKQTMPDVPADFWTKFQAKVNPDDLIAKFMPLYDKYYSKEDLHAIIAFYESPAGKRMTASLPQISAESMQIGQEFGKNLAEQVMKESGTAKPK